jgi:hypothetical protein
MILRVLTISLFLLVAGPASAQKVSIDYDPTYPASTIETFAWDAAAGETIKEKSELLHARIVNSIEQYFDAVGYRKADSDPDVFVTYHTSVQDSVKLDTTSFGYWVPTNWYVGAYGASVSFSKTNTKQTATTAKTYESGTLIVDVWDAESKQLVWRGTAPGIAVSWNPKKIEKRLDKALNKLSDQWKAIRKSAP